MACYSNVAHLLHNAKKKRHVWLIATQSIFMAINNSEQLELWYVTFIYWIITLQIYILKKSKIAHFWQGFRGTAILK